MSITEKPLVDFLRQDEAAAELKVCRRMSEGIIPLEIREILPFERFHGYAKR
jgi:hypothetical protein